MQLTRKVGFNAPTSNRHLCQDPQKTNKLRIEQNCEQSAWLPLLLSPKNCAVWVTTRADRVSAV